MTTRRYEVEEGKIVSHRGEQTNVVVERPDHATPTTLAELIQQQYDLGRDDMLGEIQEELARKRTSLPTEREPWVKADTRPKTSENWNTR